MIIELVEEAVEIKLHFEKFTGILQSDYELGYALGRMMRILSMEEEKETFDLARLKELVEERMKQYTAKDYIEENLIRLIHIYRIQNQKGDEVFKLYHIGYHKQEN